MFSKVSISCVVLLAIFSCGYLKTARTSQCSQIVIDHILDLRGGQYVLPKYSKLVFKNGGCICNGTIYGNQNSIDGNKKGIFSNVNIVGEWRVPDISTNMFLDINQNDVLKNLFCLTSPGIKNSILIEEGSYKVSLGVSSSSVLTVVSNTDVTIDGEIKLLPNENKKYKIVNVAGDNIRIKGKGAIIGDKEEHLGTEGEWGMGVHIERGKNIEISNIRIEDCWGDCIYVGGKAKDIIIYNCNIRNGRRQGISITSANNVRIKKCRIKDVGGTPPSYAIDIEPNKNDTVSHVLIDNVYINGCSGGIMTYAGAKNSKITDVQISDVMVCNTNIEKPYYFRHCEELLLKRCNSDVREIPIIEDCKQIKIK